MPLVTLVMCTLLWRLKGVSAERIVTSYDSSICSGMGRNETFAIDCSSASGLAMLLTKSLEVLDLQ